MVDVTVQEAREELERLFPQVLTHPGGRSSYSPTPENRTKVPILATCLRALRTTGWPRDAKRLLARLVAQLDLAEKYWGDARSTFELQSPAGELDPIRHLHALLLSAPEAASEVFIVHGRDMAFRDAVADLLRAVGLNVLTFIDAIAKAGGGTQSNWEAVRAGLEHPGAIVVLWNGDELVHLIPELQQSTGDARVRHQPRPNVIAETGAALQHHRTKTVLVEVPPAELPSDFDGFNTCRFADTADWRRDFAQRLESTGLAIKRDEAGTWLQAGTFAPLASTPAVQTPAATLDDIRSLLQGQAQAHAAERVRAAKDEPQRFYCFGQLASGGRTIQIVFTSKDGPVVRDAQVGLEDVAAGRTWGPFHCVPRNMARKGQGFARWEDPPSTRWPQMTGDLTWVSNGMRWRSPLVIGTPGEERLFTSSVDDAEIVGPDD